ncbi:hypothetical protein GCM10009631_21450 [Corynebacterium glaucum]
MRHQDPVLPLARQIDRQGDAEYRADNEEDSRGHVSANHGAKSLCLASSLELAKDYQTMPCNSRTHDDRTARRDLPVPFKNRPNDLAR